MCVSCISISFFSYPVQNILLKIVAEKVDKISFLDNDFFAAATAKLSRK